MLNLPDFARLKQQDPLDKRRRVSQAFVSLRDVRGETVLVFESSPAISAGQDRLILIVVGYEVLPHVSRVRGNLSTELALPAPPFYFVRVGSQVNIEA